MFRILAKYFWRGVCRFRDAGDGATMVEFALIAPPFVASLFAILQTTLFLFAQQTLQNAAVQAGRLFMTGSAQNSQLTQSQFAADVCPMVSVLFNCNDLQIDVSTYASFSGANTSAPSIYDTNCNPITNGTFNPGVQGAIMVVQIAYPWPIFGVPLGSLFSSSCNSTTEIMGVTAFRVEPY